MSNGLTTVILMTVIIMFVMSFWRQLAIFILAVAVAVFCFGAYYIISVLLR